MGTCHLREGCDRIPRAKAQYPPTTLLVRLSDLFGVPKAMTRRERTKGFPFARKKEFMAVQRATLPNGMSVRCIRTFQVPEIQRQVQQYFRHGIAVRPGDTVFDVGANIGLFSLLVYEKCQQDVAVYAFEPIPAIFAALWENLQGLDPVRLKPFEYGLSDRSRTAVFAYRPNMPTLSSAYGDDEGELERQVAGALLRNLPATPLHLRWLCLLPPFAREWLMEKTMRTAFEGEQVSCRLRTLSEVVREERVERIDLLKVDVEKGEWDVLAGIDPSDWARIRQVVMEVHDVDGRLARVESLLRTQGLIRIKVEQERLLQGSNVYALYGMRGDESPERNR
jgi:FkbM family methyltransferase